MRQGYVPVSSRASLLIIPLITSDAPGVSDVINGMVDNPQISHGG